MILYTTIPSVINNLIGRLKTAAIADAKTDVVLALTAIGTVSWFNLPYNLNKLESAIKLYQTSLLDGDLQDLIDKLGIVAWYDLFNKVVTLIEATELIETL